MTAVREDVLSMMRSWLVVPAAGLVSLFLTYAAIALGPQSFSGPVGEGGWTNRQRGWFTARGFYPPEVDEAARRAFSWTQDHAELRVAAIDRSRPYRITFRILAGRGPSTPPPPDLAFSIDGVERSREPSNNERRDYSVIAPPSAATTLTIGIDPASTFVPGPTDKRTLGVVVEHVSITAVEGRFRPLAGVAMRAAAATMALTAIVVLCGAGAWIGAIAGLALAAAYAWLLGLDGTFFGDIFIQRLDAIAIGCVIAGIAIAALKRVAPSVKAPEWPVAAAIVLVATTIKLTVFAHPGMTVGDSIFQVHRAQYVAGGNYYFTSITPRPFFEFPYAIALYVTAMPFWDLFPTELDRMRLLRGLAAGADALVGVAMYFALRRAWGRRSMALLFAALWPFSRMTFQALCTSNLTNVFGQGVFGVAMGGIGWLAAAGSTSLIGLAGVTLLIAIGLLSHFSTLSVGVPLVGAVGSLLAILGRASTRRLGAWVLASLLAAGAISYVVYYSHFHDVYRKTAERVAAREGEAETRSMVAPAPIKAQRWMAETATNFGWSLIVAAAAGAVLILRRHRADNFTIFLAAWALVWAGFSLLGIFTAIEMRSNLAAAPLILALGCYGLGAIGGASRAGAIVAAALAIAIAAGGVADWVVCLRYAHGA
jgi:hypothetical protein